MQARTKHVDAFGKSVQDGGSTPPASTISFFYASFSCICTVYDVVALSKVPAFGVWGLAIPL